MQPTGSHQQTERTRRALEAGFRAILTLYAAVLGYGMKHILDVGASSGANMSSQLLVTFRWPLFVAVTATFARYIVGAAVHVTYEHIHEGANASRNTYLLDVFFIFILALLGDAVCYAPTPIWALAWLAAFQFAAIVWASSDRSGTGWGFFTKINMCAIGFLLILIGVALLWPQFAFARPMFDWFTNLFWLVVDLGCVAALVIDLNCQLKEIKLT